MFQTRFRADSGMVQRGKTFGRYRVAECYTALLCRFLLAFSLQARQQYFCHSVHLRNLVLQVSQVLYSARFFLAIIFLHHRFDYRTVEIVGFLQTTCCFSRLLASFSWAIALLLCLFSGLFSVTRTLFLPLFSAWRFTVSASVCSPKKAETGLCGLKNFVRSVRPLSDPLAGYHGSSLGR